MRQQNTHNQVEEITTIESDEIQNNSRGSFRRIIGRTISGGLMGALAGVSFSLVAMALTQEANHGFYANNLHPSFIYDSLGLGGILTAGSTIMGGIAGGTNYFSR
jgi:hypothetical protein